MDCLGLASSPPFRHRDLLRPQKRWGWCCVMVISPAHGLLRDAERGLLRGTSCRNESVHLAGSTAGLVRAEINQPLRDERVPHLFVFPA